MAVQAIGHKPELTKEAAKDTFRKAFEGKYTIEDFPGPFRDFVVVKSPFVGVALKLEQTGVAPKLWARPLLGGLIGVLFWSGLTNEVRNFMENAPEFH